MGEVVYIKDFRKAREQKRRKSGKRERDKVAESDSRESSRPAAESVKPEDDSA